MANTDYQRDILAKQIDAAVADFARESARHKTLHRRLKTGTYVLTALAGLAGAAAGVFHETAGPALGLIVAGLSAAAGVIAAIDDLRRPGESWLIERGCLHGLRDLKRDLDFHPHAGEAELNAYFDRLQAIYATGAGQWARSRKPREPATPSP